MRERNTRGKPRGINFQWWMLFPSDPRNFSSHFVLFVLVLVFLFIYLFIYFYDPIPLSPCLLERDKARTLTIIWIWGGFS